MILIPLFCFATLLKSHLGMGICWASCKFAAYFQNTLYYEHLWMTVSELGIQWKQNVWNVRLMNQRYDQVWFLEKDFRIVSPSYFVYDYSSRKMFLMWYSIKWPNFIIWLTLLLEILGNISFSIHFSAWSKTRNQKNLNIFTTKRAFKLVLYFSLLLFC